jgi:predicted site-specific integrase-resolvase
MAENLQSAFRVGELASAWKVSRSSLYRQMNAGNLRYIKMGGSRLITHNQASEFLNSLEALTCK